MATGGPTGGGGNQGGNAPPAPAAPPAAPQPGGSRQLTASELENLKKEADLMQSINLLTETRLQQLTQIAEKEGAIQRDAEKYIKQRIERTNEIADLEKKILQETLKLEKADAQVLTNLREQLATKKEEQKKEEEKSEKIARRLELLRKEKEELLLRAEAIKRERNLHVEIFDSMKSQLASTTGLNTLFSALNGKMSIGAAFALQFAEAAGKLFTDALQSSSQFAATTGQIASMSQFTNANLGRFGVGFKDLREAAGSLFVTMSDFSKLQPEVQEKVAGSAAVMKNLGISVETSGKNFDALTKSLRMSAEEAVQTNDKLARAAIGAGIAPSKMLSEFGPAMSKMAAYGKQGVDVFISMEKAAKSLGMEMGTLNGIIGDSFDTFEGAASAAGKLNAVLGGDYLNSVEMLNATESERIVLLKESFDASGKNFDQLSKYEKKAIAAAIGISDLNEANKLFSSSTSQLRMDMMQQEATQDQLAKTQAAAADVSKQMSAAFDSLAIAMAPLAKAFKTIIEAVVAVNDFFDGYIIKIAAMGVAIFQGIKAVQSLRMAWAALDLTTTRSKIGMILTAAAIALMFFHDALLVPHSPILYTALIALPFIILAIGEAADASEKGLLALGASALMVGAGVFLAAEGLAALVASFNGLGDAAPIAAAALGIFLVAFVIMVVIMAKMAPVTAIAALGVLALGGAVLMLGGGIALAALGMAELVKSIGALAKSLGPEAVKSLLAISASVLMLASAATLMLIGAFGIRALSGAIGSIRDAIAGEGTSENIKAFGDSMIGLSQILAFEGIEDSASKVVNAIRMIAEEIASITEGDNVVKFGTAMTSLNNVLTTAKTVTEEELKPAKGFIETARQYYVAQAASKDTDKDALVAAIKELKNVFAAKETAGGTEQPMKVRLVVGADEFEAKMFGLNSNTANIIR